MYKVEMDFNRSADNEMEASLMAWDLYSYIKELESNLKACMENK